MLPRLLSPAAASACAAADVNVREQWRTNILLIRNNQGSIDNEC